MNCGELWRSAAVMGSRGGLGVRTVPARPVTRSHTPKLATRARAAAYPALEQVRCCPPENNILLGVFQVFWSCSKS